MTLDERQQATNEFFEGCKNIMAQKGKDYNPDGTAFAETEAEAKEIGVTPLKVLWILMRKHLSAIIAYVQKEGLVSEPIESRLMDVANYMALMYAWIQANKKKGP